MRFGREGQDRRGLQWLGAVRFATVWSVLAGKERGGADRIGLVWEAADRNTTPPGETSGAYCWTHRDPHSVARTLRRAAE